MSPRKSSSGARAAKPSRKPPGPEQAAPPQQSDRTWPFPIVGIGASAGGLEAMTALFKNIQSDLGMAFILVPHLDPQRESAISQIVARTTTMPVVQVEDKMIVEPNHVYVIPPNCELAIRGTCLEISDREQIRPVNATIDIFFRSLAAAHGANAIGVILSGTASDGTLGLTAIKGEGGITFAQDTRSSKYDGMPSSAIAAGCVDFILPPDEIANELARISNHPYVAGPSLSQMEDEGSIDGHMNQVFRLLRRATRVDFSEYKSPTISRRVQRRMVLHKIEKLSDYVALLLRDRNEVNALYQD
ncbi:MAG: chemotaxis protein CheB, partial [Acidobacteriaceae bacterium]